MKKTFLLAVLTAFIAFVAPPEKVVAQSYFTVSDTLTNADSTIFELPWALNKGLENTIAWQISVDSVLTNIVTLAHFDVTNYDSKSRITRWVRVSSDTVSGAGATREVMLTKTTSALRARLVLKSTGTGRDAHRLAAVIRQKDN